MFRAQFFVTIVLQASEPPDTMFSDSTTLFQESKSIFFESSKLVFILLIIFYVKVAIGRMEVILTAFCCIPTKMPVCIKARIWLLLKQLEMVLLRSFHRETPNGPSVRFTSSCRNLI